MRPVFANFLFVIGLRGGKAVVRALFELELILLLWNTILILFGREEFISYQFVLVWFALLTGDSKFSNSLSSVFIKKGKLFFDFVCIWIMQSWLWMESFQCNFHFLKKYLFLKMNKETVSQPYL